MTETNQESLNLTTGDKVHCCVYGEGTVQDDSYCTYEGYVPVMFKTGYTVNYLPNGKLPYGLNQTLFKSESKVATKQRDWLSWSFDKGFQTLDEATESARVKAESIEKEKTLHKAPNKRVVKVNPKARDYYDVVSELAEMQREHYAYFNKDPRYATVTPSDYMLIEDHLEKYGFDKRSSQLPEILGMKIEIKL